jgi:hypothetical protein
MPDPALSQAIKEAYAAAPSNVVLLHTLEIRHPTFTQPIRVVRNFADTETWVGEGGAEVEAVLDAMAADERDMVGLVARLEADAPQNPGEMAAFIALGFDLDLPPVDTIPVPEITVTMDNVGREITDALDGAATSQDRIEVTYRPYLSDDIEGPQMDPPITLVLNEVEANPLHVTGRARMLDIGNKAFPARTYTAKDFPGLAR